MAKICCVILLCLVGCAGAVESTPEKQETPADVQAFISSVDVQAKALAKTLAAQKLTGEMTLENTHVIMDKLNKLEASLAKSEPQTGKDGDPASAPSPPAKANDTQTPLKVATPGASSETLVELATRLYAAGVNTNMKTREELEAIDAQMQGVKSQPVRLYQAPSYQIGFGSSCPGGVCPVPQRVSRRGKR